MVCPSEILQSSQSCSGQQEQIYWEAPALCPAWHSHQPQQAGGCRAALLHCGSGCAAALLWETPTKRPWQSPTVAFAWAILLLVVGFFIPSLSPLPVTCCQNCAVAVCEEFYFLPFFPSVQSCKQTFNSLLTFYNVYIFLSNALYLSWKMWESENLKGFAWNHETRTFYYFVSFLLC